MAAPAEQRIVRVRTLAAVCGTLAGVGGLVHGVGEMVQGSASPAGIVFDSWVDGPIARNLGGEPAMTVVPSLLITGVLTVLASSAVIAWSWRALDRPRAGTGLVLLSAAMLLVGGGFGPPILGMLAGLVAGGAHAPVTRWAGRLGGRAGQALAAIWPAMFWVCVLNAVFLVVGSFVLGGLLGLAVPDLFVASLFLVVLSMPLAALAGVAHRVIHEPDAADAVGAVTGREATLQP
ncbi:MAG TPA: hypothetical protein VFZ70_07140 [Euzebyales bacterium]